MKDFSVEKLAELLPGRTYVIETNRVLTARVKDQLEEYLMLKTAHLKCRFLILDDGFKLTKETHKCTPKPQ